VGFILALAGWGLLTASGPGLIACLAGILPLLLVPFAEEPWLEERYGPAYKEYKRTVPRFF
jgi:protein-S-isoprenylcysteine O-methyltransferase Ste14